MLKTIDPLLNPDLLRVLALMGHGDQIVIADANFPSASVAASTVHGTALRIDCDAPRALEAVLSLMPLDEFEPEPVQTMQVVGAPDEVPDAVAAAMPILAAEGAEPTSVERFEFYERAARTFAVLRTAETRPYGNFILRKGVVTG